MAKVQQKKFQGIVKFFREDKGYGFITSIKPVVVEVEEEQITAESEFETWEGDVFCYYKSIKSGNQSYNSEFSEHSNEDGFKTLKKDDKVEFVIRMFREKPQAVDITVLN